MDRAAKLLKFVESLEIDIPWQTGDADMVESYGRNLNEQFRMPDGSNIESNQFIRCAEATRFLIQAKRIVEGLEQ